LKNTNNFFYFELHNSVLQKNNLPEKGGDKARDGVLYLRFDFKV